MWVFMLICLTYCFTVGFTFRYKEQALEEREKRIQLANDYNEEIANLLEEISRLNERLKNKKGRL